MQIGLQDLIDWCNAWLDDYYDFYEIEEVAGRQTGLAGERSGLFMEQIRIIKEMRAADEQRGNTAEFIRPRFMVWENVT